jgi:hypothetical protein
MDKFFLVQVKRTNGTIEKGVVVKDSYDDACQSYHAYLGAYAYGKDANTDYVMVQILNSKGLGMKGEVWEKAVEPQE